MRNCSFPFIFTSFELSFREVSLSAEWLSGLSVVFMNRPFVAVEVLTTATGGSGEESRTLMSFFMWICEYQKNLALFYSHHMHLCSLVKYKKSIWMCSMSDGVKIAVAQKKSKYGIIPWILVLAEISSSIRSSVPHKADHSAQILLFNLYPGNIGFWSFSGGFLLLRFVSLKKQSGDCGTIYIENIRKLEEWFRACILNRIAQSISSESLDL